MPVQSGKLCDVFLSYSSADEEQSQKLVSRLKAQGLEVWFAPSNIHGGDQFPQEIEKGLRRSQTVVLVLSPSSVESFWVRLEWQARLVQMSKDRAQKLIPLLLADCEIPPLLSSFQYVDFRNVDFNDLLAFGDKVQELVGSIRDVLPPPGVAVIGIPFAVIAMTRAEAEKLATRQAFDDPASSVEQRKRFNQFAEALEQHGLKDFVKRYADVREDWRPFETDDRTIRDIIEVVTDCVNGTHLVGSEFIIRPQYYSHDFFLDDNWIRGQTWYHLDRLGCVLILDGISIFHPGIQSALLKSKLGVEDRHALVCVSPLNPRTLMTNQVLEYEIKHQLQRAFERYFLDLDPQCMFEVGDERTLSRWLYAALPRTVETVRQQKANPAMRQRLRNAMGPSFDIARLVFNRRGL